MKISVLGTGCPKCAKLAENAEAAAKSLSVNYTLEKVTDIAEIMKFGVMLTPALAIDGKVVAAGKVLSAEEISKALTGDSGDSVGSGCSCGGCCG